MDVGYKYKAWGSILRRVMLPTDHPLAPVPSWRNPEAAMALLLLTQTNADGETEGKHGFQSLLIKEPGILPIVSGAVCSLK